MSFLPKGRYAWLGWTAIAIGVDSFFLGGKIFQPIFERIVGGGKDSNDAVGSRNEVSPKVLEVGEGTVLRPPLDDYGFWEDVGRGASPSGPDPSDPVWVQRDKETPLWRDLTFGGGFGTSFGIPTTSGQFNFTL